MPIFSTWGRVIGSLTTTGVAALTFPNLGDFREIRIEIEGLQHNSGTPDFVVQISTDNGSTYISSSYISNGATGTSGFIFSASVPVLTSISGAITLYDFNVARPTWADIRCGREGSATAARSNTARYSPSSVCNALQVTNSTATNFTSNTIVRLYGKQ